MLHPSIMGSMSPLLSAGRQLLRRSGIGCLGGMQRVAPHRQQAP